jgi:hypothetical protein
MATRHHDHHGPHGHPVAGLFGAIALVLVLLLAWYVWTGGALIGAVREIDLSPNVPTPELPAPSTPTQ